MADRGLTNVVRRLHQLSDGSKVEASDAELLRLFADRRDEAAFAVILRRHGPMVHRVCRQLLPEAHDAEDAFQATFLVLVRKAPSIGRRELLAGWLFAVARRVALRARATTVRRRALEVPVEEPVKEPAIEVASTDESLEPSVREFWSILHEEVARLPSKYRLPVVLCYLEGMTHDEAAAKLSWPKGTVAGRLARARDLLHTRLVRRGVVIPAGGLAVLLWADTAPAALPSTILRATVVAAAAYAGSPMSGEAISQTVFSLTEGVLKAMFVNKLKNVILVGGLALLFAAASAGLIAATASHRGESSTGSMAHAGPRNGSDSSPGESRGERSDAESKQSGSPSRSEASGGSSSKESEAPKKETDAIVQTLSSKIGSATACGFAADGKTLLLATTGGPERYDVATGNRLDNLTLEDAFRFCRGEFALSPDGNMTVATSATKQGALEGAMVMTPGAATRFISWPVQTMDPDTGKFEGVGTSIARFSADAGTAATWTTDGKITIWDLATGKGGTAIDAGAPGRELAIAADGKQVAAFKQGGEPRLKVWDTANGKEILSLDPVEQKIEVGDILDFSPDGKSLMSVVHKTLTLWDISTGKLTHTITLKTAATTRTAFAISPNGKMIAIAERDENLRIVDIATAKDLADCRWSSRPCNVTWSQDSKYIASGRDGRVRIWGVETLLKTKP